MRFFAAAGLAALALPASAWGGATIVTRELPLGGRALMSAQAPERFNMVGLHWRGSGRVFFRARGAAGWSGWREAEAEPEDLPDRGSDEAGRRASWRIGSPWWTGPAERLDVRISGRVTRLRAHYVWSPEEPSLHRSLQMAGAPSIITRLAWGANERIRRDNPDYARRLSAAIVHHTAGASPGSPAQSAAIVRGIQLYHVRGNGWDDIGYNFLVDRFGQVFEGRFGGVERNVIGAHAQGFNTGSAGIALIGSYGAAAPAAAARNALIRLLAWRLDVAHVDAISRTPWTSSGNPRFRQGVPLVIRAVSGHRDTGYTSCPGARVYSQLGGIARAAAALGLPKLYTPEVEGTPGGFVSFSARLSAALPWTVTIVDSANRQVALGSGLGTSVQWTWDARLVPRGSYRYRIGAGPNVRPATGTLTAAGGALTLDRVSAQPVGFTPNGDGLTDSTRISYRLGAPATVRAELQSEQGAPLAALFTATRPAGTHTFTWDAAGYPDGRYRILVAARSGRGRELVAFANVVVARTLSGFAVVPAAISPNGDGRLDSLSVSFSVAAPVLAQVAVLRGTAVSASVFTGSLPAGPQAFTWAGGIRDGDYTLALTVTDVTGPVAQTAKVRVDRVVPRLARVSRRPLRISVSEPARVTFIADGVAITIRRPRAGPFRVVLDRPFTRLDAFAEDAASNVGPRLRLR